MSFSSYFSPSNVTLLLTHPRRVIDRIAKTINETVLLPITRSDFLSTSIVDIIANQFAIGSILRIKAPSGDTLRRLCIKAGEAKTANTRIDARMETLEVL